MTPAECVLVDVGLLWVAWRLWRIGRAESQARAEMRASVRNLIETT